MNSITLPSSLVLQSPSLFFSCHSQLKPLSILSSTEIHRFHTIPRLSISPSPKAPFLCCHSSSIGAAVPSEEGAIPVMTFEDFVEKDWSFLDSEDVHQNITGIISAGGITETSKVLVSMSSEEFVDQLVDTSPCGFLLLVHESLFTLAILKEKYDDRVKCWQGELIHLPDKWASLDVVFLYFLPALPSKLEQVLGKLARHCSPGARVVISHPQGREKLEQQRGEYQELIVSELPDEMSLQKAAAMQSFEVVEFVDEPGFYLAVLQFAGSTES
ncbi:unnamed protein product [Linum tenue]|uniref:Uncharacterized protein n=1 Tax=Linum tenue TaxID=586396 RepID=A0AAV0J9L3_9ROSI|nr:unnamed protein product [Linum tenue]